MKKTILFVQILLLSCFINPLHAQLNLKEGMDSLLQQKFMLNFMVPDVPAFMALDDNPSDMLKPSAPRDLAVMFSSFRSGNEFIIPKSFAAEFAPGLFASTKINLHDYQTKYLIRMLTKTRLSLATKYEDETKFNHLAAGIKLTLIDQGDYRSDTAFLNEKIYSQLDNYESEIAAKKLEYLKAHNMTATELAMNEDLNNEIEDTLKLDLIKKEIRSSVDEYKRTHWNSTRMELTYATVASTTDSLLNKALLNRHILWLVYAIKPGKKCDWAQIIFGLNYQLINETGHFNQNQYSINTRAYFGSNKAKGFAEIQFRNRQSPIGSLQAKSLLFNCGLDLDIYSGVWVHLGGGVDNLLGKNARTQLIGNMNLYISLPENFKLF